uniref:Uncharacterized protein n=1 Tax=Arundo donax TaxID=35708 RepID=A0A0A8YJJ7_ARUDO
MGDVVTGDIICSTIVGTSDQTLSLDQGIIRLPVCWFLQA